MFTFHAPVCTVCTAQWALYFLIGEHLHTSLPPQIAMNSPAKWHQRALITQIVGNRRLLRGQTLRLLESKHFGTCISESHDQHMRRMGFIQKSSTCTLHYGYTMYNTAYLSTSAMVGLKRQTISMYYVNKHSHKYGMQLICALTSDLVLYYIHN